MTAPHSRPTDPTRFAAAIAAQVQSASQSAQAITEAALARAEASHDLNIFLSLLNRANAAKISAQRGEITPYNALEQAALLDRRIKAGAKVGALAGVPIAIKDNLCLAGSRTSAGSKILEHFIAPYTATTVAKLLAADAIIIGKANMDEFAMGSSGENSAFGPTKNPHDPLRVPGGSSSGSAAAVAAGVVPVALGSDTGGSIRLPASFCGVLGMKPTYGRASRWGVIAYGSSLDQVGPFAHNSSDLALMLDTILGHDPLDATSLPDNGQASGSFARALSGNIRGMRFGFIRESLGAGNSAGVEGAIAALRAQLKDLGAELLEVSLPSLDVAIAAYYLIACPEASSNLARYDGMVYGHRSSQGKTLEEIIMNSRSEGLGPEVRRRIMIGTYALSSGYYDAYYSKALKARALIAREFASAFAQADVLVTPTAPSPAFAIGERSDDPLAMYLIDVDTVAVNLAGLPALNIPYGFEDNGRYSATTGLPVGLQFIAPALQDEVLLTVASALETARGVK
jgi:aspartyl-tRNA(Asn)/glutamyl-tRNA(Gln) amidotransferase subunit A